MSNADRFLIGFVCMMLCFILPLVVLTRREGKSRTYLVLSIMIFYVVWYPAMTIIHEGSHYLGGILAGEQITEVRLIPQFWKGDFVAKVNTQNMSRGQGAISVPAPYVLDLLSLLIGVLLLRAIGRKRFFISALLLTLFCLRPFFDIVSNYLGFVIWNQGDFKYLAGLYGSAAIYGAGIAFSGIALGIVWRLVMRGRRPGLQNAVQNEA